MSLQPINSPTTWKRAQTSINANFTALLNAVAGEGTVDATDPVVTALLTSESGSRAAVEGIIDDILAPTLAEVAEATIRTEQTQALTPTLEETAFTVTLPTIDATAEYPLFVAPYPCKLGQVSLVSATGVGASNTDYWVVELQRRYGGAVPVASKNTRSTNGEAIVAWRDWNFDGVDLDAGEFAKGDALTVLFSKVGSPAAITTPVVTFRAPAADVEPAPIPAVVVSDDFDRTDSASSLGTADTGQVWSAVVGTWGIDTGEAYCATPVDGAHNYAVIDSAVADCTIECTLVTHTAGDNVGLTFRFVDADNCWFITREALFRRLTGTSALQASWVGNAFTNGDRMRVVLSGTSIKVYKQTGATGPFSQLADWSSSTFQTATKHGLRVYATLGGNARFDDFEVSA